MRSWLFILFFLLGVFMKAQEKSIFDVARNGTVEDVKLLMKANPDIINNTNSMSFTPLILACYRGNKEVASFLMDHVKDVDYASSEGTALSALCMHYNKDLVEKILMKKANPNFIDSHGYAPLTYAVKQQNIELAEILISYGAKKDIKDKTGLSLFESAIKIGNQDMINLLKQ